MQAYADAARQLQDCVRYLHREARLKPGAVVVLGLSTSEVAGGRIGKNSVPDLGDALAAAMLEVCAQLEIRPVFQCCEHLNRALVMEQETLDSLRLTQVNVMPVPKAGGSCGAAAYQRMRQPAVAVSIQADAAIDVGDTLVGMHIRPVAVPLRGAYRRLGEANLVQAYSRLPYIGGARAVYEEN